MRAIGLLACVGAFAIRAAWGQPCSTVEPLLQAGPQLGLDVPAQQMAILDRDGAGPAPPVLYLSGGFSQVNGLAASGWATWDGQTLAPVLGNPADAFGSMRAFDDGSGPALYVASTGPTSGTLYRFDGVNWTSVPTPTFRSISNLLVIDPDAAGPVPVSLHMATNGPQSNRVYRYNGQGWTAVGEPYSIVNHLAWHDADGAGAALPVLFRIRDWETCCSPLASGVEIHRLNGDGSWQLITSVFAGLAYSIEATVLHDFDGPGGSPARLLIGGSLLPAIFGGNQVASWDGGSWTGLPDGPSGRIYTMASYDTDGPGGPADPLLIADIRGQSSGIGRIASYDGSQWSQMGAFWGQTRTMRGDFDPDGPGPQPPSLVVSGGLRIVGGQLARNFAALQDGRWKGVVPSPSGPVYSLEVFNDGTGQRLFAGGEFAWMGTAAANNVARWDGSAWHPVGGGVTSSEGSARVRAAAVHNDGSGWAFYVGGRFDQAGGLAAGNVARWTGQAWQAVGMGVSGGEVRAIVSHDADGAGPLPAELYAGGNFAAAAGQPAHGLARWDGNSWHSVPGFEQGSVRAFRSFEDGEGRALYIAGEEIRIAGQDVNRAAKLAASGWVELPLLGAAMTVVNALAIHPYGSEHRIHALGDGLAAVLLPGGWFALLPPPEEVFAARSFQDQSGHALFTGRYRLTAGGWDWTPLLDGPVFAMSPPFDDGSGTSLFLGGDFARADWFASPHVARLRPCTHACYANCDAMFSTPVLNVADFTCFLQKFAAGEAYANCDQSVAAPVLNVADFTCFLRRFAAGCP